MSFSKNRPQLLGKVHGLQATKGLAFLASRAGRIRQELMRKEHLPMDTLPPKGHPIVSDMALAWVTQLPRMPWPNGPSLPFLQWAFQECLGETSRRSSASSSLFLELPQRVFNGSSPISLYISMHQNKTRLIFPDFHVVLVVTQHNSGLLKLFVCTIISFLADYPAVMAALFWCQPL